MRAIASLVVVLLLAPAAAQERVHDPLDGVIQHAWYLRPETTNHCTVADMVLRIARDAGVPAGVEFRPEFATIGVRTYDTSGWGRRLWPSVPTGDGDRLIDPCRR